MKAALGFVVIVCAAACGSSSPLIPELPPVPTITAISPASFTASSTPRQITVTGTGFNGAYGAAALAFQGPPTAGNFTVNGQTDTSIQFTTAFPNAGTFSVTVSIRGQASNVGQFVVTTPAG